jgi:hypothetical protein
MPQKKMRPKFITLISTLNFCLSISRVDITSYSPLLSLQAVELFSVAKHCQEIFVIHWTASMYLLLL